MQIDSGITIVDFTWTLTSTFWCLLSTRYHSSKLASFYAWCTWRNRINAYELTLVWGGAVVLTSGCRFYTLPALTVWLSTDID